MEITTELRTYDGAVAIVTGGASGIGCALCHELAARGATVVVADLQDEKAREVAAELEKRGGGATGVELDVCDAAAVKQVVDETASQHGRLDYIFNNAGIMRAGSAFQYSIDDWHSVLDVNLRGVVHGVYAAYPLMAEQGFGHIVNVSSVAGLIPWLNPAYTAAKHAVVGLSTSLQGEAALRGVRVSVLCPGAVRTDIFSPPEDGDGAPEDVREEVLSHIKFMEPDVFARIALDGVARNRAIIVTPFRARRAWRLFRFSPRIIMGMRHALLRRVAKAAREKGWDSGLV